ncbi:hypothetical protein GWK48_11005 [Metallosphaera tengchongensis]|uniref:Uncharacterized protein n=1 Tax=Metallosphaera tengchongensis TaxID=1532350 RepID=A0A6N0P0E9_9CREN|nr:hypothetical protein [Metallosphaera tengchongensis]QKR00841.1 hypothetical protein GWK48_11005 [Metallosphaera tengchongensis]
MREKHGLIELLAVSLFGISLLHFEYFLPLSLILGGFLVLKKEWKVLPVVSGLAFLVSFLFPFVRENAVFLTFLFPLTLLSKYDKAIASALFSLSVAFLPFGQFDYYVLSLVSILLIGLDYRGTIVSGVLLLLISALGVDYGDLAYFYLLFGVVSALLEPRVKIRREHYLSLGSVVFPLVHLTLPSVLLSIGLGMFFPFSIVVSGLMFYTEGVKYGLYLIPVAVVPYLLRRKGVLSSTRVLTSSLLAMGVSSFSYFFPPAFVFLFPLYKVEKRALLVSSVTFLFLSIYLFVNGIYDVLFVSVISSIVSSIVFLSSRYVFRVIPFITRDYMRLATYAVVGVTVVSTVLVLFYYYYTLAYIAFALSLALFTLLNYREDYLRFLFLVLLSLLLRYPYIPISGYKLVSRLNILVVLVPILVAALHPTLELSVTSLSSAIAYFLQRFKVPTIFSYVPPATVLYPYALLGVEVYGVHVPLGVLLPISVFVVGYLLGRRQEFLGLMYEISLALSIAFVLGLAKT